LESLQNIKQRFGIIGNNSQLNNALQKAIRVAPTDISVLVTGESGVGKEAIPKIIHSLSHRKHAKYIAVNCGAIPEGTIDSELFGHEKGSFTGATQSRNGYFEVADGGTIFLDEVGELPLTTQVRLLRVLENGEFLKVGSSAVQKTDVRIVAATNINMMDAIKKGKFREDLYYRLSVVPIFMPSLRCYREDLEELVEYFLRKYNHQYNRDVSISKSGYYYFKKYSWPGNVRELQHLIEQLVVMAEKEIIDGGDIPNRIKNNDIQPKAKEQGLQEVLDDVEREVIQNKWNELQDMSLVAKSLNIHRTTLMRKMNKLNIR